MKEGWTLCTQVQREPRTGDVEGAEVGLEVLPTEIVELARREKLAKGVSRWELTVEAILTYIGASEQKGIIQANAD